MKCPFQQLELHAWKVWVPVERFVSGTVTIFCQVQLLSGHAAAASIIFTSDGFLEHLSWADR